MQRVLFSAMAMATVALGTGSLALAQNARPNQTSNDALKRTAEGHPDLSGAWTRGGVIGVPGPGIPTLNDGRGICVINCGPPAGAGASPAGARPPRPATSFPNYKPEYKEKVAQLTKEQVKYDTSLRCVNPGLPRIGPPNKIVQSASEIVFLYEDINGAFWRIIPTVGRDHREDAEESYLGDSVGHWEDDKLVIETISFNDNFWLTDNGAFHTLDMRVVEEVSISDGKLQYQATVHDPEVLAEPWVKSISLDLTTDPLEPVPCIELSIEKMTGIESYHPNPRW